MEKKLIKNAKIYTPALPAFLGWLLVDNNRIITFQKGEPPQDLEKSCPHVIDGGGRLLLPGFIDLHTHGSLGFCTMDADPQRRWQNATRNTASHRLCRQR